MCVAASVRARLRGFVDPRVDHLEGPERILLTESGPRAGGRHHLISVDWVDYVDQKVHLNKPSKKAMREWRVAA